MLRDMTENEKRLTIGLVVVGAVVLYLFFRKTKLGQTIINEAGIAFPAIAPYLPGYSPSNISVGLTTPKSSEYGLPVMDRASELDGCRLCGTSVNVMPFQPAATPATVAPMAVMPRFGFESARSGMSTSSWTGGGGITNTVTGRTFG